MLCCFYINPHVEGWGFSASLFYVAIFCARWQVEANLPVLPGDDPRFQKAHLALRVAGTRSASARAGVQPGVWLKTINKKTRSKRNLPFGEDPWKKRQKSDGDRFPLKPTGENQTYSYKQMEGAHRLGGPSVSHLCKTRRRIQATPKPPRITWSVEASRPNKSHGSLTICTATSFKLHV